MPSSAAVKGLAAQVRVSCALLQNSLLAVSLAAKAFPVVQAMSGQLQALSAGLQLLQLLDSSQQGTRLAEICSIPKLVLLMAWLNSVVPSAGAHKDLALLLLCRPTKQPPKGTAQTAFCLFGAVKLPYLSAIVL